MGGTPAVLKLLLENGMIDGSCLTVTGKTLADNLKSCPPLSEGQVRAPKLVQPFWVTLLGFSRGKELCFAFYGFCLTLAGENVGMDNLRSCPQITN